MTCGKVLAHQQTHCAPGLAQSGHRRRCTGEKVEKGEEKGCHLSCSCRGSC